MHVSILARDVNWLEILSALGTFDTGQLSAMLVKHLNNLEVSVFCRHKEGRKS